MKKLFFAISMIFAVALTSCQNSATETSTSNLDSAQVDSAACCVDSTKVAVDSVETK